MLWIFLIPLVLSDAQGVFSWRSRTDCAHPSARGGSCPHNGKSMMQMSASIELEVHGSTARAIETEDETHRQGHTIPRIIHKSYDTLEPAWVSAATSWMSNHPDWQFMQWTSKKNRDLVKQHYPWFLSTYDGFDRNVKRFDAMRYVYMHHFGGVYADMDVSASKSLGKATSENSMMLVNVDGFLNNWFMASAPGAKFWLELLQRISSVEQLPKNLQATGMSDTNRAEYATYHNVICATGAYVLSKVWEKSFNGSMHGKGITHGLEYRVYSEQELLNILGIRHAYTGTWVARSDLHIVPINASWRLGVKPIQAEIRECDLVQPGWEETVSHVAD